MRRFFHSIRSNASKLARDERGTSVVELAFIAPVLAATIMGVTDIARGFSAKLALTQSAQSVVSKVMQSSFQVSELENLRKEAARSAEVNPEDVTIDYWLACNGVKQSAGNDEASFNADCPLGQNQSRFVKVRIAKKYEPMFRQLNLAGSNIDGNYVLHGEAGVRIQ